MNDALHDTLSISKRLKGAGMNESQAEAVAEAIHGNISAATAHLATKDDLAAVKSQLEARISSVKSELSTDIAALESRLVWRLSGMMLGTMLGTAGLVLAALRLFPP